MTEFRTIVIDRTKHDMLLLSVSTWENEENNIRNYSHLLREVDQPKLERVIKYLQDHYLQTFLGGSVVTSALHEGRPRTYRDIDLMAVGRKKAKEEVVSQLKQSDGDLFDYRTEIEFEGERIPCDLLYKINQQNDSTTNIRIVVNKPDGLTEHANADRFEIKVKEPSQSKAANIDLIITDYETFKRGLAFVLRAIGY